MKKTVAAHIKSFYEEERYSDEEIRKKRYGKQLIF